jgi:hypothetical protein
MGRFLISVVLVFSSITAFAQEDVKSLQKDMKMSTERMVSFVKKTYDLYKHKEDVSACYKLLEARDENAVNALYTVILFNHLTDTINLKEPQKAMKKNTYRKKIVPYYATSINYCKSKLVR